MCHRNTTEEYAFHVLGERVPTEEREDEEDQNRRIDGEPTRVARNASD